MDMEPCRFPFDQREFVLGFERKPMPEYLIKDEGATSIYMELFR